MSKNSAKKWFSQSTIKNLTKHILKTMLKLPWEFQHELKMSKTFENPSGACPRFCQNVSKCIGVPPEIWQLSQKCEGACPTICTFSQNWKVCIQQLEFSQIQTTVLVNSKYTSLCINKVFVQKHNLSTWHIPLLILVYNVNRTLNQNDWIIEFVQLWMTI